MTMDRKLILSIITASAFIAWVIIVSHTYGYNLTKEQEQESAILPLCYTNNTLGIEGLNKTCNNIYGGPVVPNLLLNVAYADDAQGCFLPEFCKGMQEMTQRDMRMALEIWEILNCSKRDICTPAGNLNITKCLTMDASDRPPECLVNNDGMDAEFDNDTMSSMNNWTSQEYCHDHNGNGTIVCHNMTGMKMK